MPGFTEAQWDDLIWSIQERKCTPFLGSGASRPLPLGRELASRIANRFGLLQADDLDLPRVAHYASLLPQGSEEALRRFVYEECIKSGRPTFSSPKQLHNVLASLPLEYFVTTNYDDFMAHALRLAGKTPSVEICQWHKVRWDGGYKPKPVSKPSESKPVVFHLHGAFEDRDSMVLTEEDYLQFLTVTSAHKSIIPEIIGTVFTRKLLFLGYALEDVTFKVALRKLSATMRQLSLSHLTVQLDPLKVSTDEIGLQRRLIHGEYVKKILGPRVQIYWGSCDQFASQLLDEWDRRAPRNVA